MPESVSPYSFLNHRFIWVHLNGEAWVIISALAAREAGKEKAGFCPRDMMLRVGNSSNGGQFSKSVWWLKSIIMVHYDTLN